MGFAEQLGAALRAGLADVKDYAERRVMAGASRLRLRIAQRTPILTGRASASWNAAVGEPNMNRKPATYRNPGLAPFEGEDDLVGFTLGDTIHISNDQPYIRRLNAGWSAKAPAAFVELTVEEQSLGFLGE